MTSQEAHLSTRKAKHIVENSSPIRKAFIKASDYLKRGIPVLNASLGSPSIGPGREYYKEVVRDAERMMRAEEEGKNPNGYIPNAGYEGTRKRVAFDVGGELGIPVKSEDVFMTAGAVNALDVLLATLLEPPVAYNRGKAYLARTPHKDGSLPLDEVVIMTPAFSEYLWYVQNNTGNTVLVPMNDDMTPNAQRIYDAITPHTKAVIINSGGANPTGKVLKEKELEEIANVLKQRSSEYGTRIAVIEDAPYKELIWEGKFHSIMNHYKDSFHVSSVSKAQGNANRRLGWIVMHPEAGADESDRDILRNSISTMIRLTVVNAPAQEQRILEQLGTKYTGNIYEYKENLYWFLDRIEPLKDRMDWVRPEAGFYVWAKPHMSPKEFFRRSREAQTKLVYVSGEGFLYSPLWIRISTAMPGEELEKLPGVLEEIVTK